MLSSFVNYNNRKCVNQKTKLMNFLVMCYFQEQLIYQNRLLLPHSTRVLDQDRNSHQTCNKHQQINFQK